MYALFCTSHGWNRGSIHPAITDAAASAPLEWVTATLGRPRPSAWRLRRRAAQPPVTSATLPASGFSCVLRAMMSSSLEFKCTVRYNESIRGRLPVKGRQHFF